MDSQLAPLIVLEGIDGSGKGTQAELLTQRFRATGRRTELISFPRYQETFFGARIGEFLNGAFGSLDQVPPFLVSLLYAGDRFESRGRLETARRENDVVVLDRYVPSNIAHQSAKADGDARELLQQWIEHVEYELFALPPPTLTVLLDAPVETAQELILCKQRRTYTDQAADLQEADGEYLGRVREVYREMATSRPGWTVASVLSEGRLRSREEILDQIWEVANALPTRRDGDLT